MEIAMLMQVACFGSMLMQEGDKEERRHKHPWWKASPDNLTVS